MSNMTNSDHFTALVIKACPNNPDIAQQLQTAVQVMANEAQAATIGTFHPVQQEAISAVLDEQNQPQAIHDHAAQESGNAQDGAALITESVTTEVPAAMPPEIADDDMDTDTAKAAAASKAAKLHAAESEAKAKESAKKGQSANTTAAAAKAAAKAQTLKQSTKQTNCSKETQYSTSNAKDTLVKAEST